MSYPFTLGDVVMAHARAQNKTSDEIICTMLSKLCETHVQRIMVYGSEYRPLENTISEGLATTVGRTRRYWCQVNKLCSTWYHNKCVPSKLIDLNELDKALKRKDEQVFGVKIDTVCSAKTLLGAALIYGQYLKSLEFTVQGKNGTEKLTCSPYAANTNYHRLLWLVLRRWSEQKDLSEDTVFPKSNFVENALGLHSLDYVLSYLKWEFRVGNVEFKILPVRCVHRDKSTTTISWNKDFVDMMKTEILDVSREDVHGVRWKDYL